MIGTIDACKGKSKKKLHGQKWAEQQDKAKWEAYDETFSNFSTGYVTLTRYTQMILKIK